MREKLATVNTTYYFYSRIRNYPTEDERIRL